MYSVVVHRQNEINVHPTNVHRVRRAAKLNASIHRTVMKAHGQRREHNEILQNHFYFTCYSFQQYYYTLDIVIIRDGWQLRGNTYIAKVHIGSSAWHTVMQSSICFYRVELSCFPYLLGRLLD